MMTLKEAIAHAEEKVQGRGECAEEHRQLAEWLKIVDRLEQADVINNEEIYIKACRRYGCWESECPHRARDKFCSDLAEIFFDGYELALKDIRGDKE